MALVPGGPHPYFQPWKAAAQQAKTDFSLGGITFNETSGWDQTTQNSVLTSLEAQGYNAFGVFGVSPDNINSTFSKIEHDGFPAASLGSCPAGTTDDADFCLATDVQQAAYKAAKIAIQAMGGQGNLVHLTGNKTDSNTARRDRGRAAGGRRDRRQGHADPDRHRHRHRPADRAEGRCRPVGGQGSARSTRS